MVEVVANVRLPVHPCSSYVAIGITNLWCHRAQPGVKQRLGFIWGLCVVDRVKVFFLPVSQTQLWVVLAPAVQKKSFFVLEVSFSLQKYKAVMHQPTALLWR